MIWTILDWLLQDAVVNLRWIRLNSSKLHKTLLFWVHCEVDIVPPTYTFVRWRPDQFSYIEGLYKSIIRFVMSKKSGTIISTSIEILPHSLHDEMTNEKLPICSTWKNADSNYAYLQHLDMHLTTQLCCIHVSYRHVWQAYVSQFTER